MYLFISNYLVPFKVTPLRYNTLLPAVFLILETLRKRAFWFLFRFFFYLLNRSKTLFFHRSLQFWEEEKVSGGQIMWFRWLRNKHRCVSWCFVMVQNPGLVFPQFCEPHNFMIVFLINRTTLIMLVILDCQLIFDR